MRPVERRPALSQRLQPGSPPLAPDNRDAEVERRKAWFRDQYIHPEEHRHTIAEVQSWFGENEVEYLRTYPNALIGAEPLAGSELFEPADADSARAHLTAYDEARKRGDILGAVRAHGSFHFALYEAARSPWLLRLIRPVWETSERYCLEVPACRQLIERRHEHEEILGACVEHDPARAALALHDHLATTANYIAVEMGGQPLFALAA